MATMVKEKHREKKKSTKKPLSESESPGETSSVKQNSPITKELEVPKVVLTTVADESPPLTSSKDYISEELESSNITQKEINLNPEEKPYQIETLTVPNKSESTQPLLEVENVVEARTSTEPRVYDNVYKDLNLKLDRICGPVNPVVLSEERELSMEKESAYLKEVTTNAAIEAAEIAAEDTGVELTESVDMAPSAPMLEYTEPLVLYQEQVVAQEVPKLLSMPLEEAVRLYGGKEIAEVMAMSEREEAFVEAGVLSGPGHPLVDLLSTLKHSLIAVERERTQLSVNLVEEEKYRDALWKIEKRYINETQMCDCGQSVQFKASYEHAELQKEKLPVARMKLEGILRDVTESYYYHQHAALLAHCQIEEFISETIHSSKSEIREALSLVLQALKRSDNAPLVLSSALRRWSAALAASLVDARDLRQLLFLLHHLFRQTMSVRWAASVIDLSVTDSVSASRMIALLDILLTRPHLESAVECTEDKDEEWEEVDKDGGGGAVGDGCLRERDLLALLHALPLRALVARLALVTHADLTSFRDWQWTDTSCGRDVLRACCGVRALLDVLARGVSARAHYTRLQRALRHLATSALRALAALHEKNWQTYSKELEIKIQAELEAAFVGGWSVLGPDEAYQLPTSLLSWHAARDYCAGYIDHLHSIEPHRIESLSLTITAQKCNVRVAIVAQIAVNRKQDYELARLVLEFLFKTGIRRNTTTCGAACRRAARDAVPQLLAAHPHLYAVALHLLAETSQVEKLDQSSISCLAVDKWRPQSGEARAVAADWAKRCPHLLPPLLLNVDCTPHTGLSLDTQLSLGSWLCNYTHSCSPSAVEEWCWTVLRRLRVHRTSWGLRPEAPPPDPEPDDMFSKAFALMASSWGHCIPLICSEGVAALCSLAASRAADAMHCLAPIMLLLVDSPESIASTQKFTEFFSLVLNAGPSLVQRALGRGTSSGAELLTKLVQEQLAGEKCGGVPHTALVRVWIWALWRPSLPSAATLLDSVLRPRHCWQLDEFTQYQSEEWAQQMTSAMRMSSQAPVVCHAALRAWLAQRELSVALQPRLALALHSQRASRQKIHVTNALKLIGSSTSADDLVIYKTAAAILSAPFTHIAHLHLWALLMHLYLERPQLDRQELVPPVGPLYFSGIIKSRTLAQLKRRLQDSIKHHQNEAKRLANEITQPTPVTSRVERSQSRTLDNQLLPLSITDLTCESSDSSESDCSDGEKGEESPKDSIDSENRNRNVNLTIAYHNAAELLLSKYATWLDEGEKVRARPHEADISRFIKDNLQEAAWEMSSNRAATTPSDCAPFPLPPSQPSKPPPPDPTPYNVLMEILRGIRNPRRRRSRWSSIKSPVDNVDFNDVRSLLALMDTHLKDLQKLVKELSADTSKISSLNEALWKLVQEQRVPRPVPVMKKTCTNKCNNFVYAPPGREWCISVGAVQGIKENRTQALAYIRRLARPRPHAARTAAALLTIARRTRNCDAAKRAAELALQAAGAFPADTRSDALVAFIEVLAERWLCSEGVICAYLIRRTYNNSNAQSYIGALVAPQRAKPADIPTLHSALLRGPFSPPELFSYLSRFEMGRWADAATPEARKSVLAELMDAARQWNTRSEPEYQMLLELVGLQSAAVCRETELCGLVTSCCRACVEGWLPLTHLTHVTRATRCADALACDELGHLLRELGVIWWEARTGLEGSKHARYASYAPHVATLTSALHRAFVSAAVRLSYAPERVGALAWSSLLESWSAWVVPHSAAPLLPSTGDGEHYTQMLKSFHQAVLQVMEDCPGTEEYLLSQMFEWVVQTFSCVHNAPNQESRVQVSALLAELAEAPWNSHQWLQASSLQALLQVCQVGDKELGGWSAAACEGLRAGAWLRSARASSLPPRLALLLLLFTAGVLARGKILEEATRLPWHRLPEAALEEALDRFFAQHYSLIVPYHELPQFRILLFAGELYWPPDGCINISPSGRQKRARMVSQWVRAASAPALVAHTPGHARALLAAIADAAPHLVNSEGELVELLSRSMVIMCIEPAAAAALTVWEPWVRSTTGLLCRACVSCVCGLTAFEYYAPLADAAIRAYLASSQHGTDSPIWSSIASLWANGHWRDATPLCARGRLYAAYATLAAHAQADSSIRAALLALVAASIDFIENEAIVALWICAAVRLVGRLSYEGSEGEARAAAQALLGRWGEPPRLSLLQRVTLRSSGTCPTPQHRLLSLFALCVLSPNSASEARAFEAACGSVQGLNPDVASWARAPHPKRLPRLAIRLYPNYETYFKEELDMAPEDNV